MASRKCIDCNSIEKRTALKYIATAFASLFCYGFIENLKGPTYPSILIHFNIDTATGSWIFAASSMSALISIMLGRVWLKYIGAVKGQVIFLFFMSAGSAGMGLSGYLTDGFIIILASSMIFGLGLGGTTITMNILIAKSSPPHLRRRLFSAMHSMYGLSALMAPLFFAVILKSGGSWQILFLLASFLPFIFMFMAMNMKKLPTSPEELSRPLETTIITRIRFGLIMSTYVIAEVAISSRLVIYASERLKIGDTSASQYLTAFFILLLAGRLAMSAIKTHWKTPSMMLASAIMSMLLGIAGVIIHPVFLSLCGLSMSFFFPFGIDWISKQFKDNLNYMMTSIMTTIDLMLIVAHKAIGITAERFGMGNAMLIVPISMAITVLLLIISKKDSRYE